MAAQDLSGALPRGVAIIRKSLMPITLGMAGGFAGAIASGRYLEHLIVSAQPLDLPNCVTAAVFLLVAAVPPGVRPPPFSPPIPWTPCAPDDLLGCLG